MPGNLKPVSAKVGGTCTHRSRRGLVARATRSHIAYAISGRGLLAGEDAEWVVQQRRWFEDVHCARSVRRRGEPRDRGLRGRRGRARRPQADQTGAPPGERLPAVDGCACAPRQQRRGTARLRAAQEPCYKTQSAPRRAPPLRLCIAGYSARPGDEALPLSHNSKRPRGQARDARRGQKTVRRPRLLDSRRGAQSRTARCYEALADAARHAVSPATSETGS